MEKAMQQSHGIGYQEYSRKLEKRIEVEKRREKEYKQSQLIVAQADRQLFR
jgi:hypothetical protein